MITLETDAPAPDSGHPPRHFHSPAMLNMFAFEPKLTIIVSIMPGHREIEHGAPLH
jgi:hypothetical protein